MNNQDIEKEECHFYSRSHEKLVAELAKDKNKAVKVATEVEQRPFPKFALAELELFEISPWPLVISQKWEERFDKFIKGIGPILWKSLLLYFGDDAEKFADNTGLPVVVLNILKEATLDPYNLFVRHDVMVSGNEIKLLEVNAGTAIGGWELSLIERRMADALHLMTGLDSDSVAAALIFEKLFNSLATQIKRLKTPYHTGNILFVFEREPPQDLLRLIGKQLQEYYVNSSDYVAGEVILTSGSLGISFGEEGEVRFNGTVINGLLMAGASLGVSLTLAEVSGHLVFPDSFIYKILGQKALLALPHKPQVKAKLASNEREFVDRHIPFTVTMDEEKVEFRGQISDLASLLSARRSDFVIKKSSSLAGKDVYVGCFTEPELWQELIEILCGNAHWVAQEYCEADKFLAADKSCKVVKYTPVWGVFGFENSYCGAFVRASIDSTEEGNGVINSATGALEFAVLEEQNSQTEEVGEHHSIDIAARENSYKLAASYGQLTDQLVQNKSKLAPLVSALSERRFPEFAQRGLNTYPLSHWPLLIDQNTTSKFETFVQNFESLIRHVVDYCFVENLQSWKDYFGQGQFLLSLFSEQEVNYDNLLIRHDTLISNGTVKMLEANVGCSIGGWEIDLFEASTLDAVEKLLPIDRSNFAARPFLKNLFNHFSAAIERLSLANKSRNVLFVSKPMEPHLEELFQQQLQQMYQSQNDYLGGEVLFGTDPHQITFEQDNTLTYQGRAFNALVMPNLSAYPELAFNITRAVIEGYVISADSPMFELLGNKAMMALFHEEDVKNSLPDLLRDFVDSSIPYTVKLDSPAVSFDGKACSIKDLLLCYQDRFVLKKTDSSHGVDVYIGRFCDKAEWQKLVLQLLGSPEWIAQEYCEPDSVIGADYLSNVSEFLPVWGLFSVEGHYAGAQVRAEDVNHRHGVVNTHQGASVFVVLEDKSPLAKISNTASDAKKSATNMLYSETFAAMSDFYTKKGTHTGHVLPFTLDGLPKFMGFHEELHYLPLVVSQKLVLDFEGLILGYPGVVLRAIQSMLPDEQTFIELLDESPLLFDVMRDYAPNPAELMFRFDIHCDGEQLTMLEANLGTVIGGWEADWLEPRVRARIAEFEAQSEPELYYRQVTPQMFRSLIDCILEMKRENATGIILIGTEAERSEEWLSFESALEQVFGSVKKGGYDHGRLIFFHEWQELDFSSQGKVFYQEIEVDTVFTVTPRLENQKVGLLNAQLMSAYLAKNLVFPDSPLHQVFGNKLVMPLLHDYKNSGKASNEDIAFIERYIPWSARLNSLLQERHIDKLEQVKQHRQDYVLKKSASSKGSDVVVGKYSGQTQWLEAIERACVEDDWLVQRYSPASKVYLPDGGELIENDMVLAVYGMRDRYSGAWARLVRKCDTGVINVGTGAVPMLVLEELKQQQIVII